MQQMSETREVNMNKQDKHEILTAIWVVAGSACDDQLSKLGCFLIAAFHFLAGVIAGRMDDAEDRINKEHIDEA